MTSITPMLASSLGRRDEKPNILLAQKIVKTNNNDAIKELITICKSKNRKLAADAIKVLYEIGYANPSLLKNLTSDLVSLLDTKHNRLQWGAMTALSTLASSFPEDFFEHMTKIVVTMERGTVISKDAGVKILVDLSIDANGSKLIIPVLLEFIQTAPVNQFPTYCERISSLNLEEYQTEFLEIIRSRLPEFEAYPTKYKKLMELLKKMN